LAANKSVSYIEKVNRFFPLFALVSRHLKASKTLEEARIGWHCHLTALTAIAVQSLRDAGAEVFLSEANAATSDFESIEVMRSCGARVFQGSKSREDVLAQGLELVSDTGAELIGTLLASGELKTVLGASEITTSGITALKKRTDVRIPVINLNEGRLKQRIENFHGVGDGVLEVLAITTSRSWAGSAGCVVGYGPVGAGAALYLRRAGMQVIVVEKNPVLELVAHFDGFETCSLPEALPRVDMLVTATGQKGLISKNEWQSLKNGCFVMNLGHWREELDLEALFTLSKQSLQVSEHLMEYFFGENEKRKVYVVTDGNPANVAMLTGSAEPTLIHLATEVLTLAFLRTNSGRLLPGLNVLPSEVEHFVSYLALEALGLRSFSFDENLSKTSP
jgi:adenosylhomocysteinase